MRLSQMGATARGFHGIGTARAFQISDTVEAFSTLAVGLMALVSAFALPFVLRWVF